MKKFFIFSICIISSMTFAEQTIDKSLELKLRTMFSSLKDSGYRGPRILPSLSMALKSEEGGFSSGGGGNAVVCFSSDGGISSVNLLDYFEGIRKDEANNKRIMLKGDTLEEKIKNAFRTMEKGYPHLANKLRNRALWLANNIDYFLLPADEGKLTPVHDMDLPFVPNINEKGEKCQIIRFAVQLKKHIEGQKKFYFVKDLFNHPKTTLATKTGIILHEVIYEEAIKNGADNSDFVRWFTYLISSLKFDQMTDQEIADLEYAPGGEFLSGFGVLAKRYERSGQVAFDKFVARDNVYVMNIYNLVIRGKTSSCYELGMCQLFAGEYLGKKSNSSPLFPQSSIMMKNNLLKVHDSSADKNVRDIKKIRGEIWSGYTSKVASTNYGTCHPDGGCIGDLLGVQKGHTYGVTSYTGVIVGLFTEGDFAVKLIDGRFEFKGSNVNPYLINPRDKDIILFASRNDVTIVE